MEAEKAWNNLIAIKNGKGKTSEASFVQFSGARQRIFRRKGSKDLPRQKEDQRIYRGKGSTVTLPTELQGRTEKVGDDFVPDFLCATL